MIIREAVEKDLDVLIEMAVALSRFNRENHEDQSKYDDYAKVVKSIESKAFNTFNNRSDNSKVLVVEKNKKIVGYALGKIYTEDSIADNGTGKMGLFDELYLAQDARGKGLGQKLIDKMMAWFKNKGICRVKLHAYSWNNGAKKLYEKNGFREYAVSYEKYI